MISGLRVCNNRNISAVSLKNTETDGTLEVYPDLPRADSFKNELHYIMLYFYAVVFKMELMAQY